MHLIVACVNSKQYEFQFFLKLFDTSAGYLLKLKIFTLNIEHKLRSI